MRKNDIEFNPLSHTVIYQGQSLTLNPLSYRLLEVLAETPGDILSVNEILTRVWQNKQVSPETLKQRVFVLRKAISEAEIDGIAIQSVRGEGYRLLVDEASVNSDESHIVEIAQAHKNSRLIKWGAGVAALLCVSLATFFFVTTGNTPKHLNNRVAIWSNMAQSDMPANESTVYSRWYHMLSEQMADNRLNLVLSDRQSNVLVPVQARRDRIAVISYFEVLNEQDKNIINLSIVEPKTAAVLRVSRLEATADLNIEQVLTSQLQGIISLVASGQLNLTKKQKENANDPVWRQLKALANHQ